VAQVVFFYQGEKNSRPWLVVGFPTRKYHLEEVAVWLASHYCMFI